MTQIVTAVKIERLQEISAEDAKAEGLDWVAPTFGVPGYASTWTGDPVASYAAFWDCLHGAGSWDANPFVVALTFKTHKVNIDAMPCPQPCIPLHTIEAMKRGNHP